MVTRRTRRTGEAWWRRRLFISVALSDTGRARGFRPRVWQVVLVPACACLLGVLAFGPSLRVDKAAAVPSTTTTVESSHLNRLSNTISDLQEQLAFRDRKIAVFAQEVGALRNRMARFEQIGATLYNDRYFGQYLQSMEDSGISGDGDVPIDATPLSMFQIASQLATLNRQADGVERVLETSHDLLKRTQLNRAVQPHVWPVVFERTFVSSPYGWRRDPFTGKRGWHSGVDIAAGWDAPIVASADGMVTYIGFRFGYGLTVEITHGDGLVTRYAHLNKAIVRNNQRIRAGEVLGLMGATGRATGPHLHFEVLVGGHRVDPMPFIRDGRDAARLLAQTQPENYDIGLFQ